MKEVLLDDGSSEVRITNLTPGIDECDDNFDERTARLTNIKDGIATILSESP